MVQVLNSITRAKFAAIVAAALGLAAAMPAAAGDSATVTLNATVLGVCKFTSSTATATLTNGGAGSTIDPSMTGNAAGSATIQYKCSNGTTPAFSSSPASPTTVVCGSGACNTTSMPVTIALTGGGNGTGMGSGQEKTLTVTGTILQTDYVNAIVGAYTRNVTVSVTP